MSTVFGYGEDALTLWALKHHISDILRTFRDQTPPSDCLIFYRPSFGRSGGERRAEFGEFDAIVATSENVYLIESKWDNLSIFRNDELTIEKEQGLRHRIFSWYIAHWDEKYHNNWGGFVKEQQPNFKFKGKTIAPAGSLLAGNLEFILTKSIERCRRVSSGKIKNLLLFFYNAEKSQPPTKIDGAFKLIPIDYSADIKGNFLTLFGDRGSEQAFVVNVVKS